MRRPCTNTRLGLFEKPVTTTTEKLLRLGLLWEGILLLLLNKFLGLLWDDFWIVFVRIFCSSSLLSPMRISPCLLRGKILILYVTFMPSVRGHLVLCKGIHYIILWANFLLSNGRAAELILSAFLLFVWKPCLPFSVRRSSGLLWDTYSIYNWSIIWSIILGF